MAIPNDSFLRACFATPVRALVSLCIIAGAAYAAIPFAYWAFIDAVWTGSTAADCQGKGACWIFIGQRMGQIIYGTYPEELRWRVDSALALAVIGGTVLAFLPPRSNKIVAAGLFFVTYTIAAAILLRGGVLGLEGVPTRLWGGIMLTAIIAAWTISTAVPLGLILALLRRSELSVLSKLAAAFIDSVRSLPLVGLLFLAIVMFPFFVPPGVEIDRLMRVLLAFTIFNAANLAEVFRGGLQVVPRGQDEAGRALGLPRHVVTWKIVVPQAVHLSLPGVVNVCVTIVKETTIVLIAGLFDFLGVLQLGLSDPDWLSAPQIRPTAYLFAGAVFWVICFSLSLYSLRLGARMKGQR